MRQTIFAAALVMSALGSSALAGEAVELAIEVPPDAGVLSPGEEIPIQVVGLDADGARVGFSGREVKIDATRGSVFVDRRPYMFRYRAPASVDSVQVVTLSAELIEAPIVRGHAQVTIGPAGPYVRLALRPRATDLPYGGSVEIDVLAETRDGRTIPLRDRDLKIDIRGPGSTTSPRAGSIHYAAPKARDEKSGDQAVVTARLRENEAVVGECSLRLMPSTPAVDDASDDAADDEPDAAVWPGGNLRIAMWRAWDAADAAATDAEPPAKRKLPKPGGTFVAPFDTQKLRMVVLLEDVTRTELEWWSGDRATATVQRDGPSKGGPLRESRTNKGRLVLHVELSVPEGEAGVEARLRLIRADGTTAEEALVFRRGRRGKGD